MQVTQAQLYIITYALRSVDANSIRPILEKCKNKSKTVNTPEKYRILIDSKLSEYRSKLASLSLNKMNADFIRSTIIEIDKILQNDSIHDT